MLHSIVEYYAEHESYRCGYCRKVDTNFSHGVWAHSLTVSDYQDLIDRGWRRSGKYVYKPTMNVTCCPMYTIRCKVQDFKLSKSQKKVLKRCNKFLMGENVDVNSDTEEDMEFKPGEEFLKNQNKHEDIDMSANVKDHEVDINKEGTSSDYVAENNNMDDPTNEASESGLGNKRPLKQGLGLDPSKGPCKKAKLVRVERKLEKLREKGVDTSSLSNTNKNVGKQIEDFLKELPKEFENRLQIKLVRTAPRSSEWLATAKESHQLYVKYQTIIHGDQPDKCTEPKYTDFLVNSPLLEEHSETGPPCGYGSFHQQYFLDGKLIGVGVLDILPKCISSVYFYYDPLFKHLNLGTYGTLREIAYTKSLRSMCPRLEYYYMGYYIHNCPKMKYKGNFSPSDLLCPETYKWFPLKDCLSKLEAKPYSRLDPDIDSFDTNLPGLEDLNEIKVWVKGTIMPYKLYKTKFNKNDDAELMQYARLVGAKTVKSLILIR